MGQFMIQVFTIKFGVRRGSVPSPVLFAIYIGDVSKCSKFYRYSYAILYADDILLLAPTVTLLDRLFTTCEVELKYLDMAINSKKSCCLRVGSRCDRPCNNLSTSGSHLIHWVDEMRYLGLFIVRSHTFKCCLNHTKRSLWSPYVIGQTIIFLPCSFFLLLLSSFFISSPNLSGRRLDVYHTSTHGVALVRI